MKQYATLLGEEGATADEKSVFLQKQSIIVSSKALVLLKCLNTFGHHCRLPLFTHNMNKSMWGGVQYIY